MTSNILSRFLPGPGTGSTIYDQIRDHEAAATQSQHDNDDTHDIDERNLNEEYHDDDLDALLREAADSRIASDDRDAHASSSPDAHKGTHSRVEDKPRWMRTGHYKADVRDEDHIEPENLLLEDDEKQKATEPQADLDELPPQPALPPPVPGPSMKKSRVQWDNDHRTQHFDVPYMRNKFLQGSDPPITVSQGDRYEKALLRWATVEDMDVFLDEIYFYYLQKGIWSILLQRIITLFSMIFVAVLIVFMSACINYGKVPRSHSLDQVLIPKCTQKLSFVSNFVIFSFSFACIWLSSQLVLSVPNLYKTHDFYHFCLGVKDSDIQTIAWPEIVERLMTLRDNNPNTALRTEPRHRDWMKKYSVTPVKQRMDAHDIANRLMRKSNYFIALINKDILDFSLPIAGLRNRQLYSSTLATALEWSLSDYVFNRRGEVSQFFLKDSGRKQLSEALQRRFIMFGIGLLIIAPFSLMWSILRFFLQYFTEYKNNPTEIASRAYTPLARLKFREFNELPHFFDARLNMSYEFAKHYLDQFPKDKTDRIARFVSFVAGAIVSILVIGTFLDPNTFFDFEITKGRTVLFYIGVFGTIWKVAHDMVPKEHKYYVPGDALEQVVIHIHYRPEHWTGRMHSEEVRQEFASLYQVKLVTFLEDVFGILTAPFVLMFSLPACSDKLIDFFREFTVHVDGLGYVCSFAVFDFKQGAGQENRTSSRRKGGSPRSHREDARNDYFSTKNNKMQDSMLSFKQAYLDPQFADLRPYRDKAFQLPPDFHGLSYSTQLRATSKSRHFGSQMPQSPSGRMRMSQPSLAPSMMLDRDHQNNMRKSRLVNQSRYMPLTEEEVEDQAGPSASVMFEEEGRPAPKSHAAEDLQEEENTGGGVLGLLTKLTEARGPVPPM